MGNYPNYVITEYSCSPDRILSFIHQHIVFICLYSWVIQQTFKIVKTLGQLFESLYINNILIFSKEKEDLQKLTLWVLKKLQENNLFVNLDKCTFEVKEVDYLEIIISKNQIQMDLAKLEWIRNWLALTTVKQVWSFLGFRNFIENSSDTMQILCDLWMTWQRKIWFGIGQTLVKKHLRNWKKNSRKHQCFWCPIRQNHSSLNLMPPSSLLRQSYNKRHERRLPLLWIHITLLQHDTVKLWNIQPRTHGHSLHHWNMVTLPSVWRSG